MRSLVGKLHSLWKVHFVLLVQFALTVVFDREVLYGNVALSITVILIKKRYPSVLKKVLLSETIRFKVKVMKTFKIFSDCHEKTWQPLKRRAYLEIPSTIF